MVGIPDLLDLLRIQLIDHPFSLFEALSSQKWPVPAKVVLKIDTAQHRSHLGPRNSLLAVWQPDHKVCGITHGTLVRLQDRIAITVVNCSEAEPGEVGNNLLILSPGAIRALRLRDFKYDDETWIVVFCQEFLDRCERLARGHTARPFISNAKVFKEENPFFREVTVLQVPDYRAAILNCE